jgi:uncharacterized protein
MNNSFFNRFTPKEPKFFESLQQISDVMLKAADLLIESLQTTTNDVRMSYYRRIKDEEREGDKLSHKIFEELSTSFITPFDREDIHLLADSLDDVIDRINSCAKRIAIYNPKENTPEALELAKIVRQDAVCISSATADLGMVRKNATHLKARSKELHDLENQADDIYEEAIIRLFGSEKDGIELIKTKEILNELEKATDAAEDVGKALRTVIVKYA